jgi:D-alanyl-D-alanine carboxypeptidase
MLEDTLQALLDEYAEGAPGVMLSVNAPFLSAPGSAPTQPDAPGLRWQGAAGEADRNTGEPLGVQHGFRIASMSKTFTGLLCAQLVEERRLNLHTPAVELLPPAIGEKLKACRKQHTGAIDVETLLLHRSGFNDFALSTEWFAELAADPGRFRAPVEIASWALDHAEPVGPPNSQYHYSDTGYVLLGLILEEVTGASYASLCRQRLFDPLEMHNTYLEGHEAARGALAHCYLLMDDDYVDALQINGSCDWAAGGHVSTLADLDKFLRGAFGTDTLLQPESLDAFLTGREAKEGFFYGMGVGRKIIHNKNLWGHLGHWGSFMYWCPEERMSLCGMLGHDTADHNAFIARVLEALY